MKINRTHVVSVLLGALLAMTCAINGETIGVKFPSAVPERWKLLINTSGVAAKTRLIVTIEVFRRDEVELSAIEKSGEAEHAGRVVLVKKLTADEATFYWNALKCIFQRTDLTLPFLDRLDGTFLRLELNTGRSMVGCEFRQLNEIRGVAPELVDKLAELRNLSARK